MYDIIFVGKANTEWDKLKEKYPLMKQADTFEHAASKAFTKMFWVVWDDVKVNDDFTFNYEVPIWDEKYIHVFLNDQKYNGICLFPKTSNPSDREINHRFFLDKKEIAIQASVPTPYSFQCSLASYEDYIDAINNPNVTELFWFIPDEVEPVDEFKFDLYFDHSNLYDRHANHVFLNEDKYNGIMLLSKHCQISKKEFDYRFPVARKEWPILASRPRPPQYYDQFYIDSYEEYQEALEYSKTEMFWMLSRNIQIDKNFKFDIYFDDTNDYDKNVNHAFIHRVNEEDLYTGVFLLSKKQLLSKREIEYRFPAARKEWPIVASGPITYSKFMSPRLYDIVFISCGEINAEKNWTNLKKYFPYAKRIDGIKGIHNAHIEAAKLVNTPMFWVVDADAIIVDNFYFDYQTDKTDTVFVWRSRNPINNLTYGYGGVKLLPTQLTLNMDTSTPDMTTSISNKFKVIDQVSNITEFNTDVFNTWKSAFRECVKLASKSIKGQHDEETEQRLHTWCTVANGTFAIFALRGAQAGKIYGEENAGNLPALSKINDFEWLMDEFKRTSVLR